MTFNSELPIRGLLQIAVALLLQSHVCSTAWSQENRVELSTEPSGEVIEEILVTGRRPGPPLWRATSDGKTLWIFATLTPLPEKLHWDSSSVKFLLSEADAFIEPPDVSASTSNPLKAFRAIRKLNALEKLPKGVALADVMPTDLYENFSAIKTNYAPRARNIERLRPMPAIEKLLKTVYKNAGLTNEERIYPKLLKMARRQKLRIYSSTTEVELGEVLEVFSNIPMSSEIDCMRAGLETVAIDLHASMERANAWAEGNARALLDLDYPDANSVCSLAISQSEIAREAMRASDDLWFAHAQQALANHTTTITSLPIADIARDDGLLQRLRDAGYSVRGQ